MRWTPYMIKLVLHHHTSPAPFDYKHAPIYPETIGMLCAAGILVEEDGTFTTTDLGKAMVEMWCNTPIPIVQHVVKYVDPRLVNREVDQP